MSVGSWRGEEAFITDGEGGRGISWAERAVSMVRKSEVGREEGKGMSLGSTPTFLSYIFVAKRIELQLGLVTRGKTYSRNDRRGAASSFRFSNPVIAVPFTFTVRRVIPASSLA